MLRCAPHAFSCGPLLPEEEARQRALAVLDAELAVCNQYLQGDVWGYVLYRNGQQVDSCWGCYGDDWRANGMREHWPADLVALLERQ